MSAAWIYQDDKQVKKHGSDQASWYVGWINPEGKRRCKSCGPGEQGQRNAEKLRRKIEAQLLTGTYESKSRATWQEFRQEYDAKILSGLSARTKEEVVAALSHFERIVKPKRLSVLATGHIDHFVSQRRKDRGKKKGSLTSPAT